MRRLSIIGCGNVGKTLAKLWIGTGEVEIGRVLNRSVESSCRAIEFLGQGEVATCAEELAPADFILISASDDAIEKCAQDLARCYSDEILVFNCSGAVGSSVLRQSQDWVVGSIHPIKSFADPNLAVQSFDGTFCGLEGDPFATELLAEMCSSIGGIPFVLEEQYKTTYHAGAVIACNYLVALIEAALRCYEKAGINRVTAMKMLEPFMTGTIDNVSQLGTAKALTGPIARGEVNVVEKQSNALREWDSRIGSIYDVLGLMTIQLSEAQGSASKASLDEISSVLGSGDR